MPADRIIFEQYDSMERNVDSLARVRGECLFMASRNGCGRPCAGCPTAAALAACERELSVCDRLSLGYRSRRIAEEWEARDMAYRRRTLFTVSYRTVLIAGIVILLMAVLCAKAQGEESLWYYKNDWEVRMVLQKTRENLRDRDGMYGINCVDWTYTFKEQWDMYFDPDRCVVMHNDNYRTKMHHVYVRVYSSGMYPYGIDVEPQGGDTNYSMYDQWGSKFDPVCSHAHRNPKDLLEKVIY